MIPSETAPKNTFVTTSPGMLSIANFAPKNAAKETKIGMKIIANHPIVSIISETTPSNKRWLSKENGTIVAATR